MSEPANKVRPKSLKKPVYNAIMRLEFRQKQTKAKKTARTSIDWKLVRERMNAAQLLAETNLNTEAILHGRASALSQPIATAGLATTTNTLVTLKYSSCQLALSVQYVREIIELEVVMPVPGVPQFIIGVINWRGKILTLVNLENFLGFLNTPTPLVDSTEKQSVVLIESGEFEFGLLCQGFPIIGDSEAIQFGPMDWATLEKRPEYLTGISKDGVLMLDLGGLLEDPAFLVNQE